MTTLTSTRTSPSGVGQWWVLTMRLIGPTVRNGEVAVGVLVTVAVTASLYIPLNRLISGPDLQLSSYAQFLTPLIVMQAISFASISTAFRAATDAVGGVNRRFQALPVGLLTPLAARITASLYRCALGLAVALVCAYVIGFRFYRGSAYAAAFCALALFTGLALALLGDTLGTYSRDPAATAQWLLLPQLIFGFLSVGIQPLQSFPDWVQPIVANQPISRIVDALRVLAGDSGPGAAPVSWAVIGPALAWIAGIIVVTLPWSVLVYRRRD